MGKLFGDWLYRVYLALGLLLVVLTVIFTLVPQAWVGVQTDARGQESCPCAGA